MSTGEDEPLPVLNGRLRPRKSITTIPSPQNPTLRKTEGKLAQDRPKRTSAPSKASPIQKNDLATKSDSSPTPIFLCPYCDRTFAARQSASKHARRIHLSTSKQDNFIKCLHCNHSDAESHAIIKHMVDCHPNQYFACLDCNTRFHSTTELAEHKLNVCEKQKPPYRNKLRQKTSAASKQNPKRPKRNEKSHGPNENTECTDDRVFNGIVISCELKPSEVHDATDIEDKITTNLILPPSKNLANATMEKNAVIVLDDLQWNKRIPPNFSFHNTDADQILSRLGVVHRSPRVGESRKDLIRMMDEPNEIFEKCFDTSFYSKVAKNVQDNLSMYLDGSFNFNPDKDNIIKTRKSKLGVVINTAEGFPILLSHEQFSRNLFDGFIPRTMTPKHKWKWDTTENDKNSVMLVDQSKRDSHVNNCIITLVSSLDIWTQLRMRRKFEKIFKTTPIAKKTVKQNIISMELKEILESRDIPTTSTQVVQYRETPVVAREGSELPAYLGLSPTSSNCDLQPAVLSGEWVRPRCYVCCACGEQTCDARALSTHITAQHPSAQVQHYEIVGETLLSADILKHLYVPPSQMSNRTRPPRGFRDCTKCKKSITLEDLHQHMLDCAGDTPTVRRKCRYRPFGVRRRRPRLPDNTIRKKMRKDIRSRHRQKSHLRPRIRTEVGDAETIRKMIADLPAKRNRITLSDVPRPRRNIIKIKKTVKLRPSEDIKAKARVERNFINAKKTDASKKQNDTDNSVDEDDQPLKLSAKRASTRCNDAKDAAPSRATINKKAKKKQHKKADPNMEGFHPDYYKIPPNQINPHMFQTNMIPRYMFPPDMYHSQQSSMTKQVDNLYYYHNQRRSNLAIEQSRFSLPTQEQATLAQRKQWVMKREHDKFVKEQAQRQRAVKQTQRRQLAREQAVKKQLAREQEQQNQPAKQKVNCKQTAKIRAQRNLRAKEQDKKDILSKDQALDKQLAKDQAEDSGLPKEQGQQIQLAKKNEQLNQMAKDNELHNQLTKERGQHNILGKSHQRIDVRGTGPTDIRRHSSHDDYSTQNGKNRPVERGGDDRKNFNMAPATNVPLKHSIASITTGTEPRDASIPFKHANLLPQAINVTIKNTQYSRQEFENEAIPDKLHKPPLPPYLIKLQEADEQLALHNDSREQLYMSNDSLKPVEHGEERIETKIEIDKSKLNKTRKGLNDCIAMLRTKKGLRLDLATSECGEDENLESTAIDTEITGSVNLEPPVTEQKLPEKNPGDLTLGLVGENSINLTPAQVFSRSVLPENYQSSTYSATGIQSDSINDLNLQTAAADRKIEFSQSSIQNEDKREFIRMRSSSETEYKSSSQTAHPSWIEPRESDTNPSQLLEKMRHNSYDGVPIPGEAERFLKIRQSETVNSLNQIQIESNSKIIGLTDGDLQERYSKHFTSEMFNQQIKVTLITNDNEACVPNNFENMKMTSRQAIVSPASRRTRRKPTKNDTISVTPQPSFNYRRSPQKTTGDKHTAVSPLHQGTCRNFGLGDDDAKTHEVNAHYLLAPSPIEILPLKSPPVPRVPREPYKLGLDSSEAVANVILKHDDVSQKILKNTTVTHAENKQDLRRHSIELATAQSNVANYDSLLMQANRERWDKEFLNISQTSGGPSQWHKMISEDFLKRLHENNVRCETSNELFSRYSSNLTYESLNHDTRGLLYGHPETDHSDTLNTAKTTQDNRKNLLQNEQFKPNTQYKSAQKERSTASNADCMTKEDKPFEKNNTNQEHTTNTHTSNTLDNNSQRHGVRRCSGEYFTRSSPYQRNFIDTGYEENRNSHEKTLHRAYHEAPHVTYARPAVQYSDNIYRAMPLMPSIPREINAEEMTPLDLSCDPKIRKEKAFDSCKKTTNVFKKPCGIPIKNIQDTDDHPAIISMCHNLTEQLQNIPTNPLFTCYKTTEDEPNQELVHPPATDVPLGETGKYMIHHGTNTSKSQLNLVLGPPATTISAVSNLAENTLYNSSHKNISNNNLTATSNIQDNANDSVTDQLLSQHSDCNLRNPLQSQSYNIHHQEEMLEMTFRESEKIARAFSTQVSHILPERRSSWIDDDLVNPVVDNLDPHANLNLDQHMTSVNIATNNANEMSCQKYQTTEAKSVEISAPSQICNQDVLLEKDVPMDQDPDTARKIAMLPKELVEILGTMPKDHRNQLLNILPQYVSTPVATEGKELVNINSAKVVHKTRDTSEIENKQHTVACGNLNKLTINTSISPSSVIPKKRLSPSQTTSKLNYDEAQQTLPVLHPSNMPTLTQLPPTGYDNKPHDQSPVLHPSNLPTLPQLPPSVYDGKPLEQAQVSTNKVKYVQSPLKNNDCKTSIKDQFTDAMTQKTLDKDNYETEINVVDWNEPENIKKAEDVLNSAANETISSIPPQDLIPRPITKSKNSNEQTASLRAVRIKTTSARKSFSDEKNTSTNAITYQYQTNLSADEKYTNTEQIVSPIHYSYITDCKLANSKINPETQIDNNSEMMLRPPPHEENNVFTENKAIESSIAYKMTENSEDKTSVVLDPTNEDDISHITRRDSHQSDKTVSLELSPRALQDHDHYQHDHVLGSVKSTTFPEGDNHEDAISLHQSHHDTSLDHNEIKEMIFYNTQPSVKDISGNDFSAVLKFVSESETTEENCKNTTTEESINRSSNTKDGNETLSPDISQHKKLQPNSNKALSQGKNIDHILSSDPVTESKNNIPSLSEVLSPPKDENLNEDDSEDEVSLAVLKQKHGQTTFTNSAKLENEEKINQVKVARKCRKKKITESSKIIQNDKLFGDCININNVKECSEIEQSLNDTELKGDQNKLIAKPTTATDADKDKIKKHYEFDVNKENNVTENINKIKEDDHIILPENNQSESQLDNSIDKNINDDLKDAPNFNMNLDLTPEISAIEDIQNLPAVEELEIKEKRGPVRGSALKQKKKIKTLKSFKCLNDTNLINKNPVECGNPSDLSCINDLNLMKSDIIETLDISLSNSMTENPKLHKLPEVSTMLARSQDTFVSNFPLSSEITEMSTVPLRRSRRGKSMYVDSKCLQVNENAVEVEDIDQRTPLTMKQLILSRVEKEKKSIDEHNMFEKDCVADDINLTDSKVSEVSRTKKRKQIKRKKSPQLRRKSKKSKPLNIHKNDEDTSDVSNMHSASESNSSMLRDLPNAENKNGDIESCKEDVENHPIFENTTILSKPLALDCIEKISEEPDNGIIDVQESSVAEKRKLIITDITVLDSSKSKKSKYNYEEKPSSEFEVDCENELLETKQKIATEKHLVLDKNDSIDEATKTLRKEDSEDKLLNSSNGANMESKIETNKASIINETRTTCYNRPISNRRRCSSSVSSNNANYDPYNIDFEDMLEPSRPVVKKKAKNVGNSHTANIQHHNKVNIKSEHFKSLNINSSQLIVCNAANVVDVNNESDSDSSKSDVPLQKYVEEKALESELKNKNKKSRNDSIDHVEKNEEKAVKQKSTQENIDNLANKGSIEDNTSNVNSNVEIPRSSCKGKKTTKRVNKDISLLEDETADIDHNLNTNVTSNIIPIEQTTEKQQSKERKSRRTFATPNNDDSIIMSKEEDLQLRSDKFMENFGFYSERIPRKSNLLATKKIAETYSMISNESDDNYFRSKEKPIKKSTQNENKKRSEISSEIGASEDTRNDGTNLHDQSTQTRMDDAETLIPNEPYDVVASDDGYVDSITAQNMLESEEIRNLENALFSGFKEAADANAATNCYFNFQPTNSLETIRQEVEPNVSILQVEDNHQKIEELPESTKKVRKSKPSKQVGVKDKMYPDIEEIDMFEDKFDKIKRKRRSQAVAAKQVQNVENSASVKSRKQRERKRSTKNIKKSYQSTLVPTKGALKGFDGIKISIPTQDLNMPPNVSPPRQQKKRKKVPSKRRKERSGSESTCSEYEDKDKSVLERDIYEFKDNEDAELFELRPSTVMDRFRSMHVKNKYKHKEKDKVKGDVEKEKQRAKEKERKTESKEKDLAKDERLKVKEWEVTEFEKRQKKCAMKEERRCTEKRSQQKLSYLQTKLDLKHKNAKLDENVNVSSTLENVVGPDMNEESKRYEKSSVTETTSNCVDDLTEEAVSAIAGTSGFVPDHIDESDYESELSSPEGEFIFYMSNDVNCACPSDNDSEDSDVERGCGRPNCIFKNRNADKNAAIGNIFKNNAVRYEKTDLKEPEAPRPDLDQLFDSLFETNNSELSRNQNNAAPDNTEHSLAPGPSKPVEDVENIRTSILPVLHHDYYMKHEHHPRTSNIDKISSFNEDPGRQDLTALLKPLVNTKNKTECKNTIPEETFATKVKDTSLLFQNEHTSDSKSLQVFTPDKSKDKLGLGLGAKECTKDNFTDTITDETIANTDTNRQVLTDSKDMTVKLVVPDQPTKYNKGDKFDIDKPRPIKRHNKHRTTPPADKTATEHKSDKSDTESCNESATTNYLRGLSPEEAAKMEIYAMVSAQGTHSDKSKTLSLSNSEALCRSKREDESDLRLIPRSRIRLQKKYIGENSQKPTRGIQTDKSKSSNSNDTQEESDDHSRSSKGDDRTIKKSKCKVKSFDTQYESDDDIRISKGNDRMIKDTQHESDDNIRISKRDDRTIKKSKCKVKSYDTQGDKDDDIRISKGEDRTIKKSKCKVKSYDIQYDSEDNIRISKGDDRTINKSKCKVKSYDTQYESDDDIRISKDDRTIKVTQDESYDDIRISKGDDRTINKSKCKVKSYDTQYESDDDIRISKDDRTIKVTQDESYDDIRISKGDDRTIKKSKCKVKSYDTQYESDDDIRISKGDDRTIKKAKCKVKSYGTQDESGDDIRVSKGDDRTIKKSICKLKSYDTQDESDDNIRVSKGDDCTIKGTQDESEDDIRISKGDDRTIKKSKCKVKSYDTQDGSDADIRISKGDDRTIKKSKCKVKSYDTQDGSDADIRISKGDDRTIKKSKCKVKSNSGSTRELNTESEMSPPEDAYSFAAPISRSTVDKHSPRKSDEGISTSHDYSAEAFDQASADDAGVACQRARRKCTVGKQNVLAEHWSSESEFDGVPPRPTSADSVVASVSRKKKSRKKEGHHSGGRRGSRHSSKNENRGLRAHTASGGMSDESDVCTGPARAPPGPKIRARPAHHYWSSEGEDAPDPQPQHGWIVGDSHKKLVTMLAHAKGRKRNNGDKRHLMD